MTARDGAEIPCCVPADVAELHGRAVAGILDVASFLIGLDGRIRSWSRGVGHVFGYSPEEFVGLPVARLFVPEDVALGMPELEMRTALAAGRCEDDRWHLRRDGSRLWATGMMAPVTDGDGTAVALVKLVRDRSDWWEENRRLQHAVTALEGREAARERFLATLAHELRTPLGAILSAVEAATRSGADPAARTQALGIAQRQGRHIARLVEDLYHAARAGVGAGELERARLDLRDVAHGAIEAARAAAERGGVALAGVLPEKPLAVEGDAVRLQQVFTNLLDNALKFTPSGGHVWLLATTEGDQAVVRVRDDGVGIRGEDLPRVFDLFTRAAPAADAAAEGLGIGLHLVRTLVERHGGSVQLRSEGAARGTEVSVRLPLAE